MPDNCAAALQALRHLKTGASLPHRGTTSVPATVVGAATTADVPLSIRGAVAGDIALLEPAAGRPDGLHVETVASVTATGTATMRVSNVTGAPLTLPAASYRYSLLRTVGA